MSRGGKRPGAGRPEGTTKKPKISDYITEAEVKSLVATAKKQAKMKPELLKFLLEQIFGKAPQSLELPGEQGQITLKWRTKRTK